MDIEQLARIAINTIKNKWGLPANGLLAGGSLANLVYNLVHNENAPVNDIDVFILDKEDKDKYNSVLFQFTEKNKVLNINEYEQLVVNSTINERYEILKTENKDIYNFIYFKSKSEDYSIIIKSFDLNCTKIGYIIEEDRFIIDKSFVDFIQTKSIKLESIITPYHTAIRLAKKKVELNAYVDKFEFKLLQHTIKYQLNGIIRTGFKDKYKDHYIKYQEVLKPYFYLVEDYKKTEHVKNKFNIDTKIYSLKYINDNESKDILNINMDSFFDIDKEIKYSIENCKEFLYYMRNIYGNKNKLSIWSKVKLIFNKEDDLESITIEEANLINKIITYSPKTVNILKKLSLKEQIDLINKAIKVFDSYQNAILYLENYTETNLDNLDEFTKICIEIGLRTKTNRIEYKLKQIFNIDIK